MSKIGVYKSFIYNHPFKGAPTLSNFKLVEQKLRPLEDNEYLAEAVYIRTAPNPDVAACLLQLNTVPKATQLAKIIESKNQNLSVGQYVIGDFGWQTHTIVDSINTNKQVYVVPETNNLTQALGVLGMPGFAAYFGFFEVCKPRESDTVVVSSAAGAVGSCVGQIAKIKGCKVIGIAGSNEKCSWLSKIGFDHCINYKTDNVTEKLQEYAPNGVDCYFDNVGSEISSSVIYQIKTHGRICICGVNALYYDDDVKVPEVQSSIKLKVATMEAIHVSRWRDQWDLAKQQITQWIKENKIKSKETTIEGFENVPQAFIDTLKGKYYGNVIVKV